MCTRAPAHRLEDAKCPALPLCPVLLARGIPAFTWVLEFELRSSYLYTKCPELSPQLLVGISYIFSTSTLKQKTVFILCVQVFCLHMCAPPVCLVPRRPEEGTQSLGSRVTGACEAPAGAGNKAISWSRVLHGRAISPGLGHLRAGVESLTCSTVCSRLSMPQLASAAAWVTAAASSWNEVLMVLFFLFMQASLSAQVSWNLMLHLLGAACAVGSSGFTLSTLGRTGQAALAGASGRPFLRQDPTHSDPAPQQGHTNSSTFISHLRRASLVPGWWPMCKSRRGVEPER